MKFAIISDSHDNEPNITKALDFLREKHPGISALIHCGDICTPDSLELFAKNFSGAIHVAYGNGDFETETLQAVAKKYSNIQLHGNTGELLIGKLRLGWNHYPHLAAQLAATKKYDVVFYGHDHTPFEKIVSGCQVLNPGTLAGLRNKATFAIYDTATKKAQLIILERL